MSEERWHMAGSGSESYEHTMVPALFAPWAALLLDRAQLKTGECVLDAACGTGIVARMAAPLVGRSGNVTGIDLNPSMLEVARSAWQEDERPIDWVQGDMEKMSFTDSQYDVVLCQQGLQFCPNRDAVLKEMRRVLREGGRLGLNVWRSLSHCPYMAAITEALSNHLKGDASQRMAAPCSLGSRDELRAIIEKNGYRDIHISIDVLPMRVAVLEDFLLGQFLASPIAADISALHEGARSALFEEMRVNLQHYIDDGGISVPFEAYSVIAYK